MNTSHSNASQTNAPRTRVPRRITPRSANPSGTSVSSTAEQGAFGIDSSRIDASQIAERTICLVLDLKVPSNSRRVSAAQVELDAERTEVRISKRLLGAKSLLAVNYFDARMRRYLACHCLPSLFRGGVYLLPVALVDEVDSRLQEFQTEREALVDTFINEYPELVAAAQEQLRSLFNSEDYPSPERMRASFAFTWRYLTLKVPTTLAVINHSLFVREREKAARQWDEAAQVIQKMLRVHMAELVGNMTERLAPDADGRPRIFRDTLVGHLAEFLRTFDARNVTNDAELAASVERARALLEGVDPETLRRSNDVRTTVREGFVAIQRNLDRMVTNRPARRIVLNEASTTDAVLPQSDLSDAASLIESQTMVATRT